MKGLILGLLCLAQAGCVWQSSSISSPQSTFQWPDQPVAYVQDGQVKVADQTDLTVATTLTQPSDEAFTVLWLDPLGTELVYGLKTATHYELWRYQSDNQQTDLLITLPAQPLDLQVATTTDFLAYRVQDNVYVYDLINKTQQRIHEGASAIAWSPDGRQLAYTTTPDINDTSKLLLRSLNVRRELSEASLLLEQVIGPLAWLDNATLVFETTFTDDAGASKGLMAYEIATATSRSVSPTRFSAAYTSAGISVAPSGEGILYFRPDEITEVPNIWYVSLKNGQSRLLVSNAAYPTWDATETGIYYSETQPDQPTVTTLKHVTLADLKQTTILPDGQLLITPLQ